MAGDRRTLGRSKTGRSQFLHGPPATHACPLPPQHSRVLGVGMDWAAEGRKSLLRRDLRPTFQRFLGVTASCSAASAPSPSSSCLGSSGHPFHPAAQVSWSGGPRTSRSSSHWVRSFSRDRSPFSAPSIPFFVLASSKQIVSLPLFLFSVLPSHHLFLSYWRIVLATGSMEICLVVRWTLFFFSDS